MGEKSSKVVAKTSNNTGERGGWRLVSALAAVTLAAVLVDSGSEFLALEAQAPNVVDRDLFRLSVHYLARFLAVVMPVLAIGVLVRVVIRSSSGQAWPHDKDAVTELEKRLGLRDDYGGYSVEVVPASRTITFVRRGKEVGKEVEVGRFELDSSKFELGAESLTGVGIIERYFTYRTFDSQVAANAHRGTAWLHPVEGFLRKGGSALAGIQCNSERVVFRYRRWRGGGLFPRQTDFEKRLQEMLAFCNALYSAVTFPTLVPRETALAGFDEPAGENTGECAQGQGDEPCQAAAAATFLIEQPGAEPHGPVAFLDVMRLLHERRISPLTRVRRTDERCWSPLAIEPKLSGLFPADTEPALESKLPFGAGTITSFFAKPARFLAHFPPAILIAAVMSLVCGKCAMEVQASQNNIDRAAGWQTTTGTSLGVNVRKQRRKVSDKWRTEYIVTVRYSYEVHGKPYTSNRFNILDLRSSRSYRLYLAASEANQALDAYAKGTEVTVYYDPKRPGTAVLDRDVSLGIIFVVEILLLLVTMMLSLVIIVNYLWNRKSLRSIERRFAFSFATAARAP